MLQGHNKPRFTQLSNENTSLIKDETEKLLIKGIIKETCHKEEEHGSPKFISHKSNDEIRSILNLKQLNKNIEYHYFKRDMIIAILNTLFSSCRVRTRFFLHNFSM